MSSALSAKFFHDEAAAYVWLESVLWPNGPVCPHCGGFERISVVGGTTGRMGLKRCLQCKKQFTVTVGTVFERSHVKLNLWLQAAHLLCSSKKGMSSHQIHRILGVTYRTAWFMTHRLREAMRDGSFPGPLGGEGKIVEADETYVGGKESNKHANKRNSHDMFGRKEAVLTLVERGGEARSFHVANVTAKRLAPIVFKHADTRSHLMTDGARMYPAVGARFAAHSVVNHADGEYVREGFHHSNTVESYFAILKRGVTGTFHSISEAHLHRYLAEFDFRYNTREALGIDDNKRAALLLTGAKGKRLMCRQPDNAQHV